MSIDDVIKKYFDQPNVGDTPQNKGQCVGLIECYIDDLGLPHDWGNAKDLLADADTTKFTVVKNNPSDTSQFPPIGAIMVLDGTWGNGDGHTGVVVFADGIVYAMLEQNNPTGHKPQILTHDYKGVLGWLIPSVPLDSQQSQLDQCRTDRDSHWTDLMSIQAKLKLTGDYSITVILADLDKLMTMEQAVIDKDNQLTQLNQQATDLQTQVTKLQDENKTLQVNIDTQNTQLNNLTVANAAQLNKIQDLAQQIAGLKQQLQVPVQNGFSLILLGIKKLLGR